MNGFSDVDSGWDSVRTFSFCLALCLCGFTLLTNPGETCKVGFRLVSLAFEVELLGLKTEGRITLSGMWHTSCTYLPVSVLRFLLFLDFPECNRRISNLILTVDAVTATHRSRRLSCLGSFKSEMFIFFTTRFGLTSSSSASASSSLPSPSAFFLFF